MDKGEYNKKKIINRGGGGVNNIVSITSIAPSILQILPFFFRWRISFGYFVVASKKLTLNLRYCLSMELNTAAVFFQRSQI
jgi:hypothetical protein